MIINGTRTKLEPKHAKLVEKIKVAGVAVNEAPAPKQAGWRDHLDIHPACELFPPMSEAELRELANDIEAHGLREKVNLYDDYPGVGHCVLDGRNRLDALELLGKGIFDANGYPVRDYRWVGRDEPNFDPYAYVISKNIKRRHLTAEPKRKLIADVLKATPEKSNRQIAKEVNDDHKKVGRVREKLESTGAMPQLAKTVGKDGKKRPVRKKQLPRFSAKTEPSADEEPSTGANATKGIALGQLRHAWHNVEAAAAAGHRSRLRSALKWLKQQTNHALKSEALKYEPRPPSRSPFVTLTKPMVREGRRD